MMNTPSVSYTVQMEDSYGLKENYIVTNRQKGFIIIKEGSTQEIFIRKIFRDKVKEF